MGYGYGERYAIRDTIYYDASNKQGEASYARAKREREKERRERGKATESGIYGREIILR